MTICWSIAMLAVGTAVPPSVVQGPLDQDVAEIADPPLGRYQPRLSAVWSNARFPALNATSFAGLYDVLDDVSFTGGPWAGLRGRVISQVQFGLNEGASPGAQCTVVFSFYDAGAVDAAGGGFGATADMLAGRAPFGSARFDIDSVFSGANINVFFTRSGFAVPVPDGVERVYMRASVMDRGTNSVWTGAAGAFSWRMANDLSVGQATQSVGWNEFNLGSLPAFTGNASPRGIGVANPAGQTQEHRTLAFPPGTGTPPAAANGPGLYAALSGEVTLHDPAGTIDLGTLANGCSSRQINIAPASTQYYRFRLAGPAQDALLQYLDIDSEGSHVDTSIALWRADSGELLGGDADSGGGDSAQLSFGVGRRPPLSDGRCYDGRNGELVAGSYIIGITTSNAAFGSNYGVNTAGSGGLCSLRLCTNTAGGSAGFSIRPCLSSSDFDLGDLASAFMSPPTAAMESGNVVWYRFQICNDAADDGDPGSQSSYLDFEFSRSVAGSDVAAVVFDDSGNVIATDDDSGPARFPQFSFGDSSPSRPPFGDGLEFAGQNGNLVAGAYWMGVGLASITVADGRWHARSSSASVLPANWSFFVGGIWPCPTNGCPQCPADFNQDGSVDGSDVESFFNSWQPGDNCADANQDGGVTGEDVETFFLLWEAGDPTCSG